ncbi:MAG: hypothetical protein H6729_08715 [Deltaproteobacteria bacterium]|nr:hypothetical protein [Deltaproteobacteria bacterium]
MLLSIVACSAGSSDRTDGGGVDTSVGVGDGDANVADTDAGVADTDVAEAC